MDGEVLKANVVYFPPPRAETPMSRGTSATNSRFQSQTDLINICKIYLVYFYHFVVFIHSKIDSFRSPSYFEVITMF